MLPAILTTLLWSYCLIPARRSVAQLGENAANAWRLIAAVLVMGVIAYFGGLRFSNRVAGWFFLSGMIGFGLGDIGVFFALPRLGSRLTLLMSQCVAAPLAGLVEWLWLGTTVNLMQAFSILGILLGIVLVVFPEHEKEHAEQRKYISGILFGLLAAFGQSMGAVCSRKAFALLETDGFAFEQVGTSDLVLLGATSGFVRLVGGLVVAGSFWFASRYRESWQTSPDTQPRHDALPQKIKNVLLHAATGPVLGIICFQWALATTPSVIVQPIVAMSPLVVLPLAYFLEGDRLTRRSIIGTAIAVCCVALLALIT